MPNCCSFRSPKIETVSGAHSIMGRRPRHCAHRTCPCVVLVFYLIHLLATTCTTDAHAINPSYTYGRYSYPYPYRYVYTQSHPSFSDNDNEVSYVARRRPLTQPNQRIQEGTVRKVDNENRNKYSEDYGNDPDAVLQVDGPMEVSSSSPFQTEHQGNRAKSLDKSSLSPAQKIKVKPIKLNPSQDEQLADNDNSSDDDSDDGDDDRDDGGDDEGNDNGNEDDDNKKQPNKTNVQVKNSRRSIKSNSDIESDKKSRDIDESKKSKSSSKAEDKATKNMQIEIEEDKLRAQTRRLVKWLRNRLRKRLSEVADLEHEMATEEELLVGLNRSIEGTYAERQKEIKLKIARQKALKQFQISPLGASSSSSSNPSSPAIIETELRAVESEKVGLSEQLARVTRTYETLAQVDKDLRKRLHTAGLTHWLRARGKDYMPESAVGVLSKSVEFLNPVASGLEKVYDLDVKAANFIPKRVRVHQSTFGKVLIDALMLLPLLPLFILLCRARHSILKSSNFSNVHIALYSSTFLLFESIVLAIMFQFDKLSFTPPFITFVSTFALILLLVCQCLLTLLSVATRSDTVELEVTQCGLLLALVAHFWKHVFIPSVTSDHSQDGNISSASLMTVYKLAADSPPPAGCTAHVVYAMVFGFIAQCKRNLLGWTCSLDDKAKVVIASISAWLIETFRAIKNAFSDSNTQNPKQISHGIDNLDANRMGAGNNRDDDETTTFVSSALSDSNSTLTSCSNDSHPPHSYNVKDQMEEGKPEHDQDQMQSQTEPELEAQPEPQLAAKPEPQLAAQSQLQSEPQRQQQPPPQSQPLPPPQPRLEDHVTLESEDTKQLQATKSYSDMPSRLQNITISPQSLAQTEAARTAAMASAAARYARWNGPNAWPIRQSIGSPSPLPWNEADVPGRIALARSSRFARQVQTQRRVGDGDVAKDQPGNN